MRSVKTTFVALGLGVALVAGIAVLGASPAKADHIGFSLNIGPTPYYVPAYPYPPGYYGYYGTPYPYYAPYYDEGPSFGLYFGGGGGDRDDHFRNGGHDWHGDRGNNGHVFRGGSGGHGHDRR